MKLLIIKCAYPMKGDGLKKYEDEFNRMIRESGYLILPSGFETEVAEVDCLDVFTPKLITIEPNEAEVKCNTSSCAWNVKGKCLFNLNTCANRDRKDKK